jgi:ubiquinone/menaquinone biosynthesis C-methylase UbiE
MKTNWNYSSLAESYNYRPGYSDNLLSEIFDVIGLKENSYVCDVGAGTGHLTIPLLERSVFVDAVEPNKNMREIGQERTKKYDSVRWHEGTGEDTGMESCKYDCVTFGSSFNVTDRLKALQETYRILKVDGWFGCMWNHRDLNDSIQATVENIIKEQIPEYTYGSRREDQIEIINQSNLFKKVNFLEGSVLHTVNKKTWLNAWRSHATLARQAGDKQEKIIKMIESYLFDFENENIEIPYITRIWFAQKK